MGPLEGYRMIEIAGVGPTQHAGMLLAEMGAEVIRIERPAPVELGVTLPARFNLLNRSRASVAIDLKQPKGRDVVLQLCERADVLFEGLRPGVMEGLGLGPDACMGRNGTLVYGRMTGWGQEGPLAGTAGHDPNYIALAGVLSGIGMRGGPPVYPLNLIGDFGGGALYLVSGILAALLECSRSGKGQVVDAAMIDGAASMMTGIHGLRAAGHWSGERGSNILDGGAHFMRSYETKDGRYLVVGALEDRFYQRFLDGLGVEDADLRGGRLDRARWREFGDRLAAVVRTRTRDEWIAIFDGTDACVTPVLTLEEATRHSHAEARGSYMEENGIRQPAPAPRFGRTPAAFRSPPAENGEDTVEVLSQWGVDTDTIQSLLAERVILANDKRDA